MTKRTSSLQQRKTKEITGYLIPVQTCPLMMTDLIKRNSLDVQQTGHQSIKILTQIFKVYAIIQLSLKLTSSTFNISTHKIILKEREKVQREATTVMKRNKKQRDQQKRQNLTSLRKVIAKSSRRQIMKTVKKACPSNFIPQQGALLISNSI